MSSPSPGEGYCERGSRSLLASFRACGAVCLPRSDFAGVLLFDGVDGEATRFPALLGFEGPLEYEEFIVAIDFTDGARIEEVVMIGGGEGVLGVLLCSAADWDIEC